MALSHGMGVQNSHKTLYGINNEADLLLQRIATLGFREQLRNGIAYIYFFTSCKGTFKIHDEIQTRSFSPPLLLSEA